MTQVISIGTMMQQEPRQLCEDLPRVIRLDLVASKTSHAFLSVCHRLWVLGDAPVHAQGMDATVVFAGGLKLIGPYQAVACDFVLSVSVINAIPVSAPGSSPNA
jgi:hypothetical protein